jgi:hypothetical protein
MCGAMPSRIEAGTAKVAAIASPSPLLKQLMYWCTAANGSIMAISLSRSEFVKQWSHFVAYFFSTFAGIVGSSCAE